VDGDDKIVLDESELEEAIWMPRENLPDRSDDVSLTSEMMECIRCRLQ
jgi:NADH pyrophosphatase NudC (nudix superfamily)